MVKLAGKQEGKADQRQQFRAVASERLLMWVMQQPASERLEQHELILHDQLRAHQHVSDKLYVHVEPLGGADDVLTVPGDRLGALLNELLQVQRFGPGVPIERIAYFGTATVELHVVGTELLQRIHVVLVGEAEDADRRVDTDRHLGGVQIPQEQLEHRGTLCRLAQLYLLLSALRPVALIEHRTKDVARLGQHELVAEVFQVVDLEDDITDGLLVEELRNVLDEVVLIPKDLVHIGRFRTLHGPLWRLKRQRKHMISYLIDYS